MTNLDTGKQVYASKSLDSLDERSNDYDGVISRIFLSTMTGNGSMKEDYEGQIEYSRVSSA